MQIGELARRSATSVATVRYYERIGLLPAAPRTQSGRRVYDDVELRKLLFIRHARALGFKLDDIHGLLLLSRETNRSCSEIDELARAQLAVTEAKIARLQALQDELRRISDACAGGRVAECSVLEALVEQTLCEDAHAPSANAEHVS